MLLVSLIRFLIGCLRLLMFLWIAIGETWRSSVWLSRRLLRALDGWWWIGYQPRHDAVSMVITRWVITETLQDASRWQSQEDKASDHDGFLSSQPVCCIGGHIFFTPWGELDSRWSPRSWPLHDAVAMTIMRWAISWTLSRRSGERRERWASVNSQGGKMCRTKAACG